MRLVLIVVALGLIAGCRHTPPAATSDAGTALDDAASDPDAATTETDASVIAADADFDSGLGPFPTFASLLTGPGDAVLFVGNSYTFVNDLPSVYGALAFDAMPLRVESATTGGYTLAQHATDLATDGTAIATFLRTGPAAENAFDVVVMQDQSEIPGFPQSQAEWLASRDGAAAVGMAAHARGATTLLYLTWGREHGDDLNPGLYPDFLTMEADLEAGYTAYAARLAADGTPVRVAPVGPAFARVYAAVMATGVDPATAGTDFDALYSSDGSHPSPRGTYLAACVIYSSITGRDPLRFVDDPALGLTAEESAALRVVARETLSDPSWTP